MANVIDEGTASLAPGWEKTPTRSLRDLRMVLSFRMMNELRKTDSRSEKKAAAAEAEANNCRELVAKVRAELQRRAAAGDKEAA